MEKLRNLWSRLPLNLKRYIIDAADVFFATFIGVLGLSLTAAQTDPSVTLTASFWASTLSAAALSSLKAVLKYTREKQAGYFDEMKSLDK
jgi:hypothetical protein